MKRWTRPRAATLATSAIVLYYALLGLVVLAPEGVYSGDIGVQYVQAQSLVNNGFRSLDLDYPGEFLDPERRFFPMRPPFVFTAGGATQAIFPPMAAVMDAPAVAAGGLRGMVLLSLIAAAAILYCAGRLAPAPVRPWVILALGLASPLWFYAVTGWQHAPGMALGTAAFATALTASGPASPLLAGLCAGLGATLRDEVILLVPGVAAALWVRGADSGTAVRSRVRALALMGGGAAAALAAAAAVDVWWFERPAAAHLRHAVHLLQSALHTTDASNIEMTVLRPMTLQERYDTVIEYWLLGYGHEPYLLAYVGGLAAALIVRWKTGSAAGILAWLAAILVPAALDVWELVTAPKWLAGLHRVAPYLVFAVLPWPRGQSDDRLVTRVVLMTAAIYLAIAFAGVDTTGGKSLGPRLLLPLLPLLTVPAVTRIAGYLRAASSADRWVGRAGAALVVMAVVIHAYGTTVAYFWRNQHDASAVLEIASARERIVVADDQYTAQLLFPLYYRKIIFLADSPGSAAALGAMLEARRLYGALVVSRDAEPALALEGLRFQRSEQRGRMSISYWGR